LFDKVFEKIRIPVFAKFLDVSATRQKTIAQNMANIQTPGYKAKDIDFEKVLENQKSLASQLAKTDSRHLSGRFQEKKSYIVEDNSPELKSGVNNVDVDKEMVKSAENQLYYMANAKILAGKFKALRSSIQGRS